MPHRHPVLAAMQMDSGDMQEAPVATAAGQGLGPLVVLAGHRYLPETQAHTPPRLESTQAGASAEHEPPSLTCGPQTRTPKPPSPNNDASPPSGSILTTAPIPGIPPFCPPACAPASAAGAAMGYRPHPLAPTTAKKSKARRPCARMMPKHERKAGARPKPARGAPRVPRRSRPRPSCTPSLTFVTPGIGHRRFPQFPGSKFAVSLRGLSSTATLRREVTPLGGGSGLSAQPMSTRTRMAAPPPRARQ
jgi:hypothetical protein